MAKSTPLSPPQSISIPNEFTGQFLASTALCSGEVIGAYLDGHANIVIIPVQGDPDRVAWLDPSDLETVAKMLVDARDRLRLLFGES